MRWHRVERAPYELHGAVGFPPQLHCPHRKGQGCTLKGGEGLRRGGAHGILRAPTNCTVRGRRLWHPHESPVRTSQATAATTEAAACAGGRDGCAAQLGVYDADEVYHFFHTFPTTA